MNILFLPQEYNRQSLDNYHLIIKRKDQARTFWILDLSVVRNDFCHESRMGNVS
jgi:hypothetical protein